MRHLLGIITLLLAAVGTWLYLAGDSTNGGIALRVSLVLAATWLAWPALAESGSRRLGIVVLVVALVVLRPRSAWIVVPAVLVWAAMRRARA
jgi:hypothetical protein